MTGPIRFARGTAPQERESQEPPRLSPIMKYSPSGTCQVLLKWLVSARRSWLVTYGSVNLAHVFEPGFLTETKPWPFSCTVCPGKPISRLTKVVPPSPWQSTEAAAGALNTTICPRCGASKSYSSFSASTRSSDEPRQPHPGLAQLSVCSIEDEGIRYGWATPASKISTTPLATPIVTSQSTSLRQGCGIRPSGRRSTRISPENTAALEAIQNGGICGPPLRPASTWLLIAASSRTWSRSRPALARAARSS